MEPLISVIVPVYNVERYLDRCVESVVNQTYKNLEIILVDDGSPDGCPAKCDSWAKKDSRIKVIHKQNGGVSSARNAGLDVAKGEFIGFVDSDDYISEEMYELLYKAVTKSSAEIAVCNFTKINEDNEQLPTLAFKAQLLSDHTEIVKSYLTDTLCDPGVPNKLYSGELLKGIYFDETKKVGEDFLFNYYAFNRASCVAAIKQTLYYYFCVRGTSAVNSAKEEMIMRWENTKQILREVENGVYDLCLKRFVNEFLCCYREMIKSKSAEIIERCNPYFINEVKNEYETLSNAEGLSRSNRINLFMLKYYPGFFRLLYSVYLKIK